MKIATWNINGIKARQADVLAWLRQSQPDIACLQEIKSTDALFPRSEIENLGYYIETHGQKSFNGVALLSKTRPEDVIRGLPNMLQAGENQARFIEAVYPVKGKALRISSLYFPNGNPVLRDLTAGTEDNSAFLKAAGDKYAYKLAWTEQFCQFARKRLKNEEYYVLAGDYNVIPAPQDAARPQQWVQDALFLPQTRTLFYKLLNLGFSDALRSVIPSRQEAYTFWDYQAGAWQKNNGIRIDHMLLSPEASDKLRSAYIQKELRSRLKPSDHVPVWVDLAL